MISTFRLTSVILILPSFYYTFAMDFLTLNFGQLLHVLDHELKNIIRNFVKQKKQIISAQNSILFNLTCIYVKFCVIY